MFQSKILWVCMLIEYFTNWVTLLKGSKLTLSISDSKDKVAGSFGGLHADRIIQGLISFHHNTHNKILRFLNQSI